MKKQFMAVVFSFFAFFTAVGCQLLDIDSQQIYSYQDPYYLGLNDVVVSCERKRRLASIEQWHQVFNQMLQQYQDARQRVKFAQLRQVDRSQLCNLVQFWQQTPVKWSSYHRDEQLAHWMNIYHLMIVHIIVERYQEVNEPGRPNKPEFRSLLNIGNKGLALFEQYQWDIMGRYRSLDEVEGEIIKRGGFLARVALYRGMQGFAALPKETLKGDSVKNYFQQFIKKIVNEEIFYDHQADHPTAYLPGALKIYIEEAGLSQVYLRQLLSQHLDLAQWGGVLEGEELLKQEGGEYLWKLKFDPVNWQLAEVHE